MDVASFADIEDEFMARVRRIVWCTARRQNDFLARSATSVPDIDRFDFWFAPVGRRHRLRVEAILECLS